MMLSFYNYSKGKGQSVLSSVIILLVLILALVLFVSFFVSLYYDGAAQQNDVSQDEDSFDEVSLFSQLGWNMDGGCYSISMIDTDGDGVYDECDNCVDYYNAYQDDSDKDGIGDVCDFSSGGSNSGGFECSRDSDCGDDGYVSEASCSGKDVVRDYKEYSCDEAGTSQSSCSHETVEKVVETCDTTCSDGECVEPQNISCSSNNDCGINDFLGGPFCSGNSVLKVFQSWSCKNAGSVNSYCENSLANITISNCLDSCVNGACQNFTCHTNLDCNDGNSTTEDVCHAGGTGNSYCTHDEIKCFANSDCGTDGFVGDTTCSGKNVTQSFKTWTCNNAGTAQSSCTSAQQTKVKQVCSDICSGGACQGVACYSNSDCGTDGFVGSKFCIGNSLYRMFDNHVCSFGGTASAICGLNSVQKLVTNCFYACAGNDCIRCDQDLDCDDGKSNTLDKCELSGTAASYCSHQDIATCSNECASSGSRECSNNGYRICGNYDSDSCLEWSQATTCSVGQSCQNGACVSSCTNECTPGARECYASGFRVCGNFDLDSCYEWSLPTDCGLGKSCQNGACVLN